MVAMAEVPAGAEEKNRYKDVLPSKQCDIAPMYNYGCAFHHIYKVECNCSCSFSFSLHTDPHTRVALFLKFGVFNSDYINANYIRVCDICGLDQIPQCIHTVHMHNFDLLMHVHVCMHGCRAMRTSQRYTLQPRAHFTGPLMIFGEWFGSRNHP